MTLNFKQKSILLFSILIFSTCHTVGMDCDDERGVKRFRQEDSNQLTQPSSKRLKNEDSSENKDTDPIWFPAESSSIPEFTGDLIDFTPPTVDELTDVAHHGFLNQLSPKEADIALYEIFNKEIELEKYCLVRNPLLGIFPPEILIMIIQLFHDDTPNKLFPHSQLEMAFKKIACNPISFNMNGINFKATINMKIPGEPIRVCEGAGSLKLQRLLTSFPFQLKRIEHQGMGQNLKLKCTYNMTDHFDIVLTPNFSNLEYVPSKCIFFSEENNGHMYFKMNHIQYGCGSNRSPLGRSFTSGSIVWAHSPITSEYSLDDPSLIHILLLKK